MDKKLEKKIRTLIKEVLGNTFGNKYECINSAKSWSEGAKNLFYQSPYLLFKFLIHNKLIFYKYKYFFSIKQNLIFSAVVVPLSYKIKK